MKHHSVSRTGFSLVELLVVMTVIAVLASLVLGVSGFALNKANSSRAQSEIQGLSGACESFKADNGDYPRVALNDSTNTSDTLDPNTVVPPLSASASDPYSKSTLVLYTNLSGDVNCSGVAAQTGTTGVRSKVYYEFPAKSLAIKGNQGTANSVIAIIDPWRVPYGYSTIYEADVQLAKFSPSSNNAPRGYNPTFDLWSTCNVTPPKAPTIGQQGDVQLRWVKNWTDCFK